MTALDLSLQSLPTPCLLLDRTRLNRNIERMRNRVARLGVTLRPHLKTAKSVDAAFCVLGTPAGPATVSTLKEAEIFGAAGIADLLYAVSISPQKLQRVTQLRKNGIDLKIILDCVAAAEFVSRHASQSADPIPVLIEVDVDGHRSGVRWDDRDTLLAIGRCLAQGDAELHGVMCHAGESYAVHEPEVLAQAAEREQTRTLAAAETLRTRGFSCPTVSVGSTPTGLSASRHDGVTELRAGVYMFFDLVQAGIGVCSIDDIALSVLATVIGHQSEKGWIITDAGWTALSSDRGTARQASDQYYGLVCDLDGRPYHDLVVLKTSQEHGIIAARPGSGATIPRLKVGDRVRILPNHACATAAQHDRYHLLDAKNAVVATWSRFGGW